MATLEDRVRARLRQLRFERGLTLAELASAAGMATSTLSRLESGARRITLEHVSRLAGALGVDTDALTATRAEPAAEPQARDGKTWWPLADESAAGPRMYRVRIPAELSEPSLRSHEGHQWLYVIRGRVRLVIEAADMVLERGEAAAFHTWSPHWVGGVGEPAEILVIFDPDGEPLRLRRS
jgi:transcriptional regulator with XRE-family HTH domain